VDPLLVDPEPLFRRLLDGLHAHALRALEFAWETDSLGSDDLRTAALDLEVLDPQVPAGHEVRRRFMDEAADLLTATSLSLPDGPPLEGWRFADLAYGMLADGFPSEAVRAFKERFVPLSTFGLRFPELLRSCCRDEASLARHFAEAAIRMARERLITPTALVLEREDVLQALVARIRSHLLPDPDVVHATALSASKRSGEPPIPLKEWADRTRIVCPW
jgi:hypothetical protein